MSNNLPAPRKPFRRRTLVLFLACVTALALMVPAMAHGHGGGHHGGGRGWNTQVQKQVTVCTVEGCEIAGRHVHNGVTYCGSSHECGFCDGRCLTLCPVDGCTTAGPHVHNGVTYCGNNHAAGYCGGTCAAAATGTGYRHGCHH